MIIRHPHAGFNPRLPGGRRREKDGIIEWRFQFQSTPSGGKATTVVRARRRRQNVSIHAFRGEGDPQRPETSRRHRSFNPRLPGGRRLRASCNTCSTSPFQSTPSGGKATAGMIECIHNRCRFTPRLPGGRRPQYLGLLCPVPARYCSMIRIFRVALGTICPYIRFLRCC